jgi:hypothetical protein
VLLKQRNHLRCPVQVRVDLDGTTEELERTSRIAQLQVDLTGARQGTEVLGVALEHLIAIRQ